MSFSSDIKKELARQLPDEYHCLVAETAAILRFAGETQGNARHGMLLVETENVVLAKKYLSLIKKSFDISVDLKIHKVPSGKANIYRIRLSSDECNADAGDNFSRVWKETADWDNPDFASGLLEYSCCRRAYIRGAFLASGSMNDPGKSYHFEIVCRSSDAAQELAHIIETFEIEAKMIRRKNKYIVYLKDSESIVDILNVMGASGALMHLENVRIIKDMKNSANRQSNCDSANISKTVLAASRQLDDIRLIENTMGLSNLSPQLREMAEVRMEHPEESLQELGAYLNPPIGKSGANHRLAKLGEIAQNLREQTETENQ